MMRSRWVSVSLVAVCALSATGCIPTPGSDAITIGVTVSDASNAYAAALMDRADEVGAAAGVTITAQDAGGDASVQNEQVLQFIDDGVDAILVDAVDPDQLSANGDAVFESEIPVIALSRFQQTTSGMVAFDDVEAATIACRELGTALGGEGTVMIVGDDLLVDADFERMGGCGGGLAEFPGITIPANWGSDGTPEGAANSLAEAFGQYPDIVGLFATSETVALVAAEQYDVPVVTVGGSDEIVAALTDDSSLIAVAVDSPTERLTLAIGLAQSLVSGVEPPNRAPEAQPTLVTRETVGDYEGW